VGVSFLVSCPDVFLAVSPLVAVTMSDTLPGYRDGEKQNAECETQPSAGLSVSLGETPPHGSALLLCPSQWSALLEAAPVSLVVREMRDGVAVIEDPDFECEGESEAEEREGEKIPRLVFAEDDEIRTPLGGQTPDPDRTYSTAEDMRHYRSATKTLENVALELDNHPSTCSLPLPFSPLCGTSNPTTHKTTTGLWSPSVPNSPLVSHCSPIPPPSSLSIPSHSVANLELTIESDTVPPPPQETHLEYRHQELLIGLTI
jgi:hypothetical protein